ncbi:CinA family protein [Nesterenkonia halotolerans]|uniref:Nicotinamide-nucleotide amidase n=1 Tax=Nesterenkonia halotolerans TaxID=225325 RepID=A0ABR9J611_9MICC|nr:CinA family protein [Nesterenkonia halotolerans]MBE1514433.1 nicotinamide-nucleotide amidase [Nesterenkonia halotolerans]
MKSVESIEAEATDIVAEIGEIISERRLTVAVAESLTGGKLANQFAATEGSGEWFAGGVVAYQSEAKRRVLGVPPGPVISQEAVTSMVQGVTALFGADSGIAASGAGGPGGQEGQAPGTTWIAARVSDTVETELHFFSGEPLEILAQTQLHCLQLLRSVLMRQRPAAWEAEFPG